MTKNPLDLLEKAVHRGEQPSPDETTPGHVLEALDWSEDDSGQDLVERAGTVKDADVSPDASR
jgi:hypothetical protein